METAAYWWYRVKRFGIANVESIDYNLNGQTLTWEEKHVYGSDSESVSRNVNADTWPSMSMCGVHTRVGWQRGTCADGEGVLTSILSFYRNPYASSETADNAFIIIPQCGFSFSGQVFELNDPPPPSFFFAYINWYVNNNVGSEATISSTWAVGDSGGDFTQTQVIADAVIVGPEAATTGGGLTASFTPPELKIEVLELW
jgi:hypothetical protein